MVLSEVKVPVISFTFAALFVVLLFGYLATGNYSVGTASGTVTNINSWQGSDLETYQNLTVIYNGEGHCGLYAQWPIGCSEGAVTVSCNYYHIGDNLTFDLYQNTGFYNWFPSGQKQITDIANAPSGCYITYVSGTYEGYY